jgi:hypothetical protein
LSAGAIKSLFFCLPVIGRIWEKAIPESDIPTEPPTMGLVLNRIMSTFGFSSPLARRLVI